MIYFRLDIDMKCIEKKQGFSLRWQTNHPQFIYHKEEILLDAVYPILEQIHGGFAQLKIWIDKRNAGGKQRTIV